MKRGRVKNTMFHDLVESIEEAGRIHRGEIPPSRKFVFEPMDIKAIRKRLSKSQEEFALMIGVSVDTGIKCIKEASRQLKRYYSFMS